MCRGASEDSMKIALITPVPAQSRQGNRVTALRWARIFKALGHRITIAQEYDGKPYDLMVALHARRSFAAIECFRRLYPMAPLIVVMTWHSVPRLRWLQTHAITGWESCRAGRRCAS